MSDTESRKESQDKNEIETETNHGGAKRVPLFLKITYIGIPVWVVYYVVSSPYHFQVESSLFKVVCIVVLIAAIILVSVLHVRPQRAEHDFSNVLRSDKVKGAFQMNQKNSQAWLWILQRATAVFLMLCLIIHLWPQHYSFEKGIMFGVTSGRFTSPWWMVFYLLFLGALVFHGLNGIWSIFLDYSKKLETRRAVGWAIFGLGVLTYGFGVIAFAPFILEAL